MPGRDRMEEVPGLLPGGTPRPRSVALRDRQGVRR